ncbi:MAG: VWA domain-containing protein [Bryobacteraceae bacterium]|jgi:VWFA-related protein
MALLSRAAGFLILYALPLRAQTPAREVFIRTHAYTPPSAILHAESNLVESGLTVRDSRGRAVGGLHASDFEVLDNGVPQRITAFSKVESDGKAGAAASAPDSAKPSETVPAASVPPPELRFVTFFFDDFHMGIGDLSFVKQAARAFIAKGLKPLDRMSIVTASGQGDLDFTNDAKLFAERLEHLGPHNRYVVPSYCGVSPIDSYIFLHNLDGQIIEEAIGAAVPCAGCAAQDTPQACRAKAIPIAQQAASSAWEQLQAQSHDTLAALTFAAKRLSEVKGTRILVLTSSGFLLRPGVPPELQRVIDAAVHWNIVVHAIGAQGLEARMPGPKDSLRRDLFLMPLENIAKGTGGHYFRDNNDIAGDMELAAGPAVAYLLAFHPGSPDGKFHTLKIRFKIKRGDSLEFRPGYFSRTDESEKKLSARAPLDDAVFSKQTLHDVPATVTLAGGQPADGTTATVSIRIALDVNRLQFATANGRHMQQLVLLMTLLDANGNFVTGKESIMDLALTDEKLASFQKDGLNTIATLNAPAGIYQLRTIVREGMKGGLSASTTAVELPAK